MRRGEVWLVSFGATVGDEIRKLRPAVIVSDEGVGVLSLKVVVPLTKWQDRYTERKWMVSLEPTTENGLIKRSAADAFQINSVSTDRFLRQIGTLSETEMQAIIKAIALVKAIELLPGSSIKIHDISTGKIPIKKAPSVTAGENSTSECIYQNYFNMNRKKTPTPSSKKKSASKIKCHRWPQTDNPLPLLPKQWYFHRPCE